MTAARTRERIVTRLIEEEMRESFLDYSMSVIVQRALPDVRDGLKPVHRRILYAMYDLGLLPGRPYKKSATVVGEVLGKYHPHGDAAVYDTLVRMVQDFSMRYPLIDGQGNFGSIDGDSAAAYRYTEARLAQAAMELLDEIERDTVDFGPNFDNQRTEPLVLPSRIPNLLVNGSSGIAVGMSTNVPPHNLREVASAVRALVEDPGMGIDELMEHVPGPDFPTGAFIVGAEGIRDMYETGRGRVVMRARMTREALRGGKAQLVVTELPYAVSKSKIMEQIADLSRKGKLEDVSDLRDESDRDGIRVVIELKRGADPGRVVQLLYKRTYLQATFGAILLALDRGQPREFDLKRLLEEYRDHRLDVIVRRTRHDLGKAEHEWHITHGLLIAVDNIDEVIRIIRESEDRAQAAERLRAALDLSEEQADAILNMRLGKLTALETQELRERLGELEGIIEELQAILASRDRQLEVLLAELDEVVEQHGDARRTEILPDAEEEVDAEEMESSLADEDVVVTLSHEGFVKRMPVHLYRRRIGSGKALAGMEKYDDDFLEKIFVARTQGWILAFTEEGQAHFLAVADLPESGRASRGQSIYALAGADRGDPIVAVLPVDELDEEGRFVVFLTEGGIMKRTSLSEFSNPRSGGVIAAGLKEGDRILDVGVSDGSSEVLLLTRGGRAIRFPEDEISVMGRTAQGVKGIDLRDEDEVVGMLLLRREAQVLTVTEDGTGKRVPVDEFPLQKRGGLGTMILPSGGGSGPLVGALEVLESDEVMLVRAGGGVDRVAAADIPLQGRRTRGARLVKIPKGDRVVEVARVYGNGGRANGGRSNGERPDEGDGLGGAVEDGAGVAVSGGEPQLDFLGDEE